MLAIDAGLFRFGTIDLAKELHYKNCLGIGCCESNDYLERRGDIVAIGLVFCGTLLSSISNFCTSLSLTKFT